VTGIGNKGGSGFGRFPDGEKIMRFDLWVVKEIECFRKRKILCNDKNLCSFKGKTTA